MKILLGIAFFVFLGVIRDRIVDPILRSVRR